MSTYLNVYCIILDTKNQIFPTLSRLMALAKFRLIYRALNITGDIKISKQSLNCRTLYEILHFQLRGFIATDEVIEY